MALSVASIIKTDEIEFDGRVVDFQVEPWLFSVCLIGVTALLAPMCLIQDLQKFKVKIYWFFVIFASSFWAM
jgi:hypothetical protein